MDFPLLANRPALMAPGTSHEERSRAREIVSIYGNTPVARFTLFDDKSYFFSTGGSMVAYILEGKTVITLGDPIGPDFDFSRCLTEFREFCSRNGWTSVFYQVLPNNLKGYYSAGLDSLCIGQDGIVDLSAFTVEGKESKNIRNSFNKMTRLGYSFHLCEPPHPSFLLNEINSISEKWLSSRGGYEIGFSIGWLDKEYLNTCPIFLVRNPNGFAEAFANTIFEIHSNEAIIDLMRYRPGSKNGEMDFLFTSVLLWAKDRGIASFNLGFSPFAGIGEDPRSPLIERALHFVLEHTNHFPNFKGLQFFKEKFNPTWSPRYLVYPGLRNLPNVVMSIMRAYKIKRLIGRSFFRGK